MSPGFIRKRLEATRFFNGQFREFRRAGHSPEEAVDLAMEAAKEKYGADIDWEKLLTILIEVAKLLLTFL